MDHPSLTFRFQQNRAQVIGLAAAAPPLACGGLALLRQTLTAETSVLLLVLVIVGSAATGIRAAGVAAALSSGVWFDFFLTQPYYRFTITDPEDIEATVLLVLIGLAVSEVALWGRREQARASRRAGYLDGVLSTAEIVAASHEEPNLLLGRVSAQVEHLLDIEECRFVVGPVDDPRVAVMDHNGVLTRQGDRIQVERDGLPTDGPSALLILHRGRLIGHFLLTSAARIARPSLEQRKVAVVLATQVAPVVANAVE